MALFARIARHEAEDMAKEKIEFAQKNQWRIELLKQALSENFAHLTARVASKLLEGWTVGAASKSVARTTVRYESPDGDYFRSTLEVVRHFAGMGSNRPLRRPFLRHGRRSCSFCETELEF